MEREERQLVSLLICVIKLPLFPIIVKHFICGHYIESFQKSTIHIWSNFVNFKPSFQKPVSKKRKTIELELVCICFPFEIKNRSLQNVNFTRHVVVEWFFMNNKVKCFNFNCTTSLNIIWYSPDNSLVHFRLFFHSQFYSAKVLTMVIFKT